MNTSRALEQVLGDLWYAFSVRERKKRLSIALDLKAWHQATKRELKPLRKLSKTSDDTVRAVLDEHLRLFEAAIDQAHYALYQSLKESLMKQLSKGAQYYQAHALSVYLLKDAYRIKPPRLKKRWIFTQRHVKPYNYTPKDYHQTAQFFYLFNTIVDNHRKRIYYKNGRIKVGAFRRFYYELYYHFVSRGNLHDYHIKKPLQARFQTNGGIYGWEVAGQMVYIGRTQNFDARMKQHERCIQMRCPEQKYQAILSPHEVTVHLLAITNNQDAQKVLETVYYQRYQPRLNAIQTLTLEKIVSNAKLKAIWEETLQSDHRLYEAEDEIYTKVLKARQHSAKQHLDEALKLIKPA